MKNTHVLANAIESRLPEQQRLRMLYLSRLDLVDPDGRTKLG